MNTIPEIDHHCGSWVAVNRKTGKAGIILERRNADRVDLDKYELLTDAQWLANLNKAT